jgi:signal transduction histidine kinase/CheY-like chemotaxis protein
MSPYSRWSSFQTSFQFKLFLAFTLLTFLISGFLGTLFVINEIKDKRHIASNQLQLQTKHLAESIRLPLYAENLDLLRQMAEQAAQTPEIRAVVISASDGRVLAAVYPKNHSSGSSASTNIISHTLEVRSNPLVDTVESSIAGGRDGTIALLGSVRLERGTADLAREIRREIVLSFCVATVFWLTVSLLCYLILRRLIRSFNILVHGINAMQGGDLTARIPIESDDEAGMIAHAVNQLARALQERNEENIRLQDERLTIERQMLHAQKLESLGVMAGGIAHDFNNLLQSILGNMELALMKLPSDSVPQKHIVSAMKSGRQAAHLTSLMLAYTGKGFINKKELNLNVLVKENIEILSSAASTNVTIKLRLSSELPPILADVAQIQQVVMNLILNAVESFSGKPGIVTLTTDIQNCDHNYFISSLLAEKPAPGRFVFLKVKDNGCGMSEDVLKRLFDPFFSTKFAGRGLGMSAVMGIVKTHSGALFVESEPGRGTTFTVLFPSPESAPPTTVQEPAAAAPLPEAETLQEQPLSGVALVVDDEKPVLRICTKMVQLCGFTVLTARDGVDAVSLYREHADEIVVVLMDLTMPNMDGVTAMNEIFSINPEARIILSSGFSDEELYSRITGQAPSGSIRKPYSMNVLEAELKRVMQTG